MAPQHLLQAELVQFCVAEEVLEDDAEGGLVHVVRRLPGKERKGAWQACGRSAACVEVPTTMCGTSERINPIKHNLH